MAESTLGYRTDLSELVIAFKMHQWMVSPSACDSDVCRSSCGNEAEIITMLSA